MNQIDFGRAAVIPAMAGFFFFGKRVKVQEIHEESPSQLPTVVKNDSNGQTGVARYLLSAPLVTTVTKYVKKSEKQHMTGVAKYVLRQKIAEKNAPVQTGVSKYLVKVAKGQSGCQKTGVDKYLLKQEWAVRNASVLTGVAKYQEEQDAVVRKKAAVELVKKYREAEAEAAKVAKETAQAAYITSRLAEKELGDMVEAPAATRVGRYLQAQQAVALVNAEPTGVAKYLARQIIIGSQKPTLSKVSKYLRDQSLHQIKKPSVTVTGVAKYLSRQPPTIGPVPVKDKPVESGVARYLAAQEAVESTKPIQSGVSKYLHKQAQLALAASKQPEGNIEKCLEGEFIPANEYVPARTTGVSRYLDKQVVMVVPATETTKGRVTGVSRYLDKQSSLVNQSLAVAPITGVDRYLKKRA